MKKKPLLLSAALLLFCSLLVFPIKVSGGTDSVVFHPKLGITVDSLMNSAYNIFGSIPGFSAGRLYLTGDGEYRLHLIRKVENRAQILILNVSQIRIGDMLREIANRYRVKEKGGQPFVTPVFPVEETDWTEKFLFKKVVLSDGNEIVGTLIQARYDTLTIKTPGGLYIPVPDSNIEEAIELHREADHGKWIRVDPNQSRLFFAPTGHKLKPGSGYFADYYVFFPTVAVGILDFFSISGGMSILPGADKQLFYFAPKITVSLSPAVGLSTGFLTLKVPDEKGFTLGYAVTTFGGNLTCVTLGAGLPINRDSNENAILLVGGESQISNNAKLITENWIFAGEDNFILFSGGIRFFSDKLAVDFAFISTKELMRGGGFPLIPYVDFAYFFGK